MDRQKLLIIAAVIVTILIIILSFGLKAGRNQQPVTLEVWGVYDEASFYNDLFGDYLKKNKYLTINYQQKSFENYETDLVNALAAGQGPDIFSLHNTWLPKHKDKINPLPEDSQLLDFRKVSDVFVDVVQKDFVADNQIYALPLYVDSLALYYNKDLFNSAGISLPPQTWDEFMSDATKLTKLDQFGNIQTAGAALGTAKNINRSTDILGLLMLQSGAQMVSDNHQVATFNNRVSKEGESSIPGEDALRFFIDFSNPLKKSYSWNRQMPYSIDAFYQGKVAMMLNYSHHLATIKEKAPYLNFAVTSAPQIEGRSFDINYANYWGYAVSKNSSNPEEAWKLILYLTNKANAKKYLAKAQRPTARRDLISWQADSGLGLFANQSLSAQSWYQTDSQAEETVLADMIESVVLGASTIKDAINKAADQVTILMK